MLNRRNTAAVLLILLSPAALCAYADEASLAQQIKGLRGVSDAERPAVTSKIALDLRSLPAGLPKVKLADALANLSTEGDPGQETLQVVADTLALSLKESPPPPGKEGTPALPYMDLARLVRYESVRTDLADPMLTQASGILAADDADVARADFTLLDTNGRKYTLSALKGRVVLVNFWATWCPPCRKEMNDLDAIYMRYKSRGLVVVSITSEGPEPVISFLSSAHYHPPVLIDEDGAVTKQFHVVGLPRTFVFDRNGKLVSQAIDMRTRRQFLDMLAHAGLQPARRN
jgi:thiol-disulfide isomerase/thioredoxin